MKPSDQDRLLKAILAGEDLAYLRQRSLDCTLIFQRQCQRRRRVLRVCAIVVPPLFLTAILLLSPSRTREQLASSPPPPAPAQVQARASDVGVKFITDEELLALFPERSVALIGKPGSQQLVFLDKRNGAGIKSGR